MFHSSFSSKPFLVLDIGSSGVHGAVAAPDASGKFDIRKVSRSPLLILPEVSVKKLWRKIHASAADVIRDLASGAQPHDAVLVFSSPWYFSEVRKFRRESETPMAVNAKMLDSFVREETERFRGASFKQFRVTAEEVSVLPPQVMRVMLNGYPAVVSAETPARTIEAFIYFSAIFGRATDDIRALLDEHGIRIHSIQTSPFVFYTDISAQDSAQEGRLVVDIGGEITEVTLIRNGVLYDSASYARGFNFIARRLAEIFSVDLEEAVLYLENYASGSLEAAKNERIQKIVGSAIAEWKDSLAEVLEHLASKGLLPESAVVTGPGNMLSEFKNALADAALRPFSIFGRSFEVKTLSMDAFVSRFINIPSAFSRPELMNLLVDLCYAIR